MADFQIAIKKTLPWEGGYSNEPADKGGETYAGISRVHNPDWPGWPEIDAAKPLKRYAKVPYADPYVEIYYELHYWPVVKGDLIKDQRVAGFIFDWYVNSGIWAIKKLQQILCLQDDGILGPKTLSVVNATEPAGLFESLKKSRIAFVNKIVANNPSQNKNLAGWIKRIKSFQ